MYSVEAHIFDPIAVEVPRKKIFSRLGYALGKTVLSVQQKSQVDTYITEAADNCILKGAARRVPLERAESGIIALAGKIVFKSKSLYERFGKCEELLLFAATAGINIMRCIKELTLANDMARAVVYDAVASEMVDAALDWITRYYATVVARENKKVDERRFSCGYGDFSLDNQKILWETLDLQRLGVRLTSTCMMDPEKSVTAVSGISSISKA